MESEVGVDKTRNVGVGVRKTKTLESKSGVGVWSRSLGVGVESGSRKNRTIESGVRLAKNKVPKSELSLILNNETPESESGIDVRSLSRKN